MKLRAGTIHALAADPAVKAALARIPRAPSTLPIDERAPAGKRDLPHIAGQPSPAMVAVWSKPSYRQRMSKVMRRGHAVRNVLDAARILVGQRTAKGMPDESAFERLAQALDYLKGLPL